MALTTVAEIRLIPEFASTARISDAYLELTIANADAAIKSYLKRDIEETNYTEYYSGIGQCDLVLRQCPVFAAETTITVASNGATLPVATLNVVSTTGFPTGSVSNPATLSIQTGLTTCTTITYTGKTATTFTGCSGGTGTLATGYNVGTPTVFVDPQGYFGQNPSGFGTGTQLYQGNQFAVVVDQTSKSNRGLLKRIGGGGGGGFVGFYPENFYAGKLGARRLPVWQTGQGNIKVQYAAGFTSVPADLRYAAMMLTTYMIRNLPSGASLSSESLGSYSYSVLQASNEIPEIGALARTLARYRESSW